MLLGFEGLELQGLEGLLTVHRNGVARKYWRSPEKPKSRLSYTMGLGSVSSALLPFFILGVSFLDRIPGKRAPLFI